MMFICFALTSVAPILAATASGIFFNSENWNVTLVDVDSKLGSFTTYPPSSIAPQDEGSWQNYGTWDAISYDVYYTSAAWSKVHCVQLSYLWDLVTPFCDAYFVPCPQKKKRSASAENKPDSSKHNKNETGAHRLSLQSCSFYVSGTCSSSGDPKFVLTTDCTKK
jgi:hypothetical protein